MKKMFTLFLTFFMLITIVSCKSEDNVKEIVFYIEQYSEDYLDTSELYKPIESERIDAFNNYIKEEGYNIKLVVKAYPATEGIDDMSLSSRKNRINDILKHDENIDVINFDSAYLSELEPLDEYLTSKEGKQLAKQVSSNRLETLKVNDKLYYFPKVIYPLMTKKVSFNKAYYQLHKDDINNNLQSTKQLLSYFNDNYEIQDNYILANNFDVSALIFEDYQKIANTPFYIRRSDGKVINPYNEKDILEIMEIIVQIRNKGFTGKGLNGDELKDIIDKNNIIMNLYDGNSERIAPESEDMISFDLDKERYCYTGGFSILANSKNKEEAFTLISIMNTDKKAASLLQYGSDPKKDNEGKIISNAHMYYGSWNNLGNDYICESAQGQPENKALYFREMEDNANFDSRTYPLVYDYSKMESKIDELNKIPTSDASVESCLACLRGEDALDTDAFMKEIENINQRLEAAGANDVIKMLQEQVDRWKGL